MGERKSLVFKNGHGRKKPKKNPEFPSHDQKSKKIRDALAENAIDVEIDRAVTGTQVRTIEKASERVALLQVEWAVFYPDMSIHQFCVNFKGYSESEYTSMMTIAPSVEWKNKREEYRNKISSDIATRHIDKLAKMNDEHLKAGRLGLAKGLQMLSRGVDVVKKAKGDENPIRFNRALYPQEFNFVMNGIKTAQQIYRTSMGLPSDGNGMRQVLEDLNNNARTIQQNIQINVRNEEAKSDPSGKAELKAFMEGLNHEDIRALVSRKRELNDNKKEETEEKINS